MKKTIFLLLIFTDLIFSNAVNIEKKIVENHDFLEISKNYMETHAIHLKKSKVNRTLSQLNNVNFALTPRISPIKPFDRLKVHYAYPLKIFLPKGFTVTSATLSNSSSSPSKSQNIVEITVDNSFESGLLDIVYIEHGEIKEGKYLSIFIDKYVFAELDDVAANKLYTQVKYYKPKKINNQQILASLKPFEYSSPLSQVKYMGVTYSIHLVNMVENGKYIKELKDKKYINCALVYNNVTYNYYIK